MLKDYILKCYTISKEKGWYETQRSPLEIHALIHSEISEATEEVRNNQKYFYLDGDKPCGESIELIDAMIRIFDYFGAKGWDIDELFEIKCEYNKNRPHRHGNKLY